MRSRSISASVSAYGRACRWAISARRIFAAATCFIALVICCVFLSERIRSRRSLTDAILERLVELRDGDVELLFDVVRKLVAVGDGLGNLRMLLVENAHESARPVLQACRG